MKPLAITLGDPAGIGPEIVLRALDGLAVPIWLFGSRTLTAHSGAIPPNVRFFDVGITTGPFRFGEINPDCGRIALASIDLAAAALERGDCSALVTAPIHKQAIAAAGSTYPGHTEILAARAGLTRYGRDYAMYFDSPSIRTVLHSVHVPLTEAIAAITAQSVAELAVLTDREYRRLHGSAPRMAAAGINPHAGEGGRFGREEETIAAGVAIAKRAGILIDGPHAADTVFLSARNGKYDVVMSMFHDQGLIAVKTLEFERSVNVTLGLPYLRCSVDHGTAFDIAGKSMASPGPMRYAIEWAASHAPR